MSTAYLTNNNGKIKMYFGKTGRKRAVNYARKHRRTCVFSLVGRGRVTRSTKVNSLRVKKIFCGSF